MFQVLLEVLKEIAQWVIDKILQEILKGGAREIGKQAVAILLERREEILLWLRRNPQVVGLCLVVCVATFAVVYASPLLLTEPTLAAIGSAFML